MRVYSMIFRNFAAKYQNTYKRMKRFLLIILNVLAISMSVSASDYDQNTPFGFCMRSFPTDATST